LVAELLQVLVLSVLAENRIEIRVKSLSSILQVKEMRDLGCPGGVASYFCCCPGTWSKLRMPGCHPASSEFLTSSAYADESSGVVGLCQRRETLYHHMQFLFHVEMAIPI